MKTAVNVTRWPREAQDLLGRLRRDFPREPVRWARCAGPEGEPHERELYVGFLETMLCPVCAVEVPTQPLEKVSPAAPA